MFGCSGLALAAVSRGLNLTSWYGGLFTPVQRLGATENVLPLNMDATMTWVTADIFVHRTSCKLGLRKGLAGTNHSGLGLCQGSAARWPCRGRRADNDRDPDSLTGPLGLLERLGRGLKSALGLASPKQPTEGRPDLGPLARASEALPAPLRLLGSLLQPLLQPLVGLVGGLLRESQDDTQLVLQAAQAALRQSRYGPVVELGPIFAQSYVSSNINGQKSAQVRLQFEVQGPSLTGTASCAATIDARGQVQLQDLQVNGEQVTKEFSPQGGVIDVDR